MSEKLYERAINQGRKPPAYQEYAASMLANRDFRIMSLAERGLLFTLRMECWENDHVPACVADLARYLGFETAEIEKFLTERVKTFLNEDSGSLSCPELDDYKKHLQERRYKQKKGGERGAAITNAKRNKSKSSANAGVKGKPSSNPQLPRQVGDVSLVKQNSAKHSKTQSLDVEVNDSWTKDYEIGERLVENEYSRVRGK